MLLVEEERSPRSYYFKLALYLPMFIFSRVSKGVPHVARKGQVDERTYVRRLIAIRLPCNQREAITKRWKKGRRDFGAPMFQRITEWCSVIF